MRLLLTLVLLVELLVDSALVVLEQRRVVGEEGLAGHEAERLAALLSLLLLLLDLGFELGLLLGSLLLLPLLEGLQSHARAIVELQRGALLLDLLLQGHFLVAIVVGLGTLILLEHVALGQSVHVLAVVAVVGALPVETVEVFLDGLKEVLAGDDGVCGDFADLAARVRVDVNVGLLGVRHTHIVAVLALLALLAHARLEVRTQSQLLVNSAVLSDLHLGHSLEKRSNKCVLLGLRLLCLVLRAILLLDSLGSSLQVACLIGVLSLTLTSANLTLLETSLQ